MEWTAVTCNSFITSLNYFLSLFLCIEITFRVFRYFVISIKKYQIPARSLQY